MDRTTLNHDAFKINGSYLEDKNIGYTTTKAVGRESLVKQLDTYNNGTGGETLMRTNYPKRNIDISYIVRGSSLADLRDKMHKLQTLLNVENAEIIFNDDPNCYYIATPVMSSSVKEAKNTAIGTFTLVCHDPFKYSKTLTTVQTSTKTETVTDEDGNTSTVTSQVLTTDNSGGYKTYPTFKAQFGTDETSGGSIGDLADCGYVLFAKGGTNYSIQIGDDEEADIAPGAVKMGQDFKKGAGSFTLSNSITPPLTDLAFQGTIQTTATAGLRASSYGTAVSSKYYGPLVVYDLGSNVTGAFNLQWEQVVACDSNTATGRNQAGAFYVFLLNSSNQVVYAIGAEKNQVGTYFGNIYACQDSTWHAYPAKQINFLKGSGTGQIKRFYDSNNSYWQTNIIIPFLDAKLGSVGDTAGTVRKIAFFFARYSSFSALYSNRVTSVRFLSGEDNPNTFSSGDVATADCGTASITLNGEENDNLGDVGNNWEDMYLDVGQNTIYVQYSDWVTSGYEPTISMTYRKRWL